MSGASGNLYRWDVCRGPAVDVGSCPPVCYITDFPPLPSETSREYFRRLSTLIAHNEPKPRKWWRFWA